MVPGDLRWFSKNATVKCILFIGIFRSYNNALRWFPRDLTNSLVPSGNKPNVDSDNCKVSIAFLPMEFTHQLQGYFTAVLLRICNLFARHMSFVGFMSPANRLFIQQLVKANERKTLKPHIRLTTKKLSKAILRGLHRWFLLTEIVNAESISMPSCLV